jgi:uncharacterized membrane protein
MKPFVLLISLFLVGLALTLVTPGLTLKLCGKTALSVMLVFTAIGHFRFTRGMSMMLPEKVPGRKGIVRATGLIEILASIGLLTPSASRVTGMLLIIFFILVLPSNIYAAINRVNYEKGDFSGKGLPYLWFRIPFQVLLVAWTYVFVLR